MHLLKVEGGVQQNDSLADGQVRRVARPGNLVELGFSRPEESAAVDLQVMVMVMMTTTMMMMWKGRSIFSRATENGPGSCTHQVHSEVPALLHPTQ